MAHHSPGKALGEGVKSGASALKLKELADTLPGFGTCCSPPEESVAAMLASRAGIWVWRAAVAGAGAAMGVSAETPPSEAGITGASG